MSQDMMLSVADIDGDFKVAELISALQNCKEQHIKQYQDALDVYRQDVATKISELVSKHASVADTLTDFKVTSNFGLTAPVNCVDGYENMINLFSKLQSDVIKMSFNEANRIFNNDWTWIQTASASNSFYSSRKL